GPWQIVYHVPPPAQSRIEKSRGPDGEAVRIRIDPPRAEVVCNLAEVGADSDPELVGGGRAEGAGEAEIPDRPLVRAVGGGSGLGHQVEGARVPSVSAADRGLQGDLGPGVVSPAGEGPGPGDATRQRRDVAPLPGVGTESDRGGPEQGTEGHRIGAHL